MRSKMDDGPFLKGHVRYKSSGLLRSVCNRARERDFVFACAIEERPRAFTD